jgi:hypothetical protein
VTTAARNTIEIGDRAQKNKAYPVIRPNGEVEIFGGCGAVSEVLTGAV